jgi:hypothetical protein
VKRFFSTAVLGLAATALSVMPSVAAPPEPVVPGGMPLEGCGFALQVEYTGKVKDIGPLRVFPSERVTLTNTDTGASVTYVIAGVLTLTDFGLRVKGHNLVALGTVGPILYTTGSQIFTAFGDTGTLEESHGNVVNVCDVLAP